MFWESNPTNIESPVFCGNTAITLITRKTPRDPILPMFSLCLSAMLVCGILRFNESKCFSEELGRTVGLRVRDPLNFSESGWWCRILSEMKALITILIGLLVVGCGEKESHKTAREGASTAPEQKTKARSKLSLIVLK